MIYSTTPTSNSSAVSNSSAFSGQLPQQIFTRREIIPFQNDVLWRIEHGAVRTLTWSEDGTFITLGYWGLGDLIGYPLSRVKPYQIECLTGVEASIVPPHLWHQDINALLSHIQQAEDLVTYSPRRHFVDGGGFSVTPGNPSDISWALKDGMPHRPMFYISRGIMITAVTSAT